MSPRGFRQRFGLCLALALSPAWCSALPVRAEEPERNQLMILQTGRLLEGRISRSPNGFVVEHAAGRLVVPFDQVRVVGDNLPDAFQRLRETFVNPTAATHYQLALWCASHELLDQMRTELVLALDRDPEHEAARALLKRTDAERQAARKRAAQAASPKDEPRFAYGIELPEVESLAGLSRETAAYFTTRIQPLLLNKCGNASCHGSKSESTFQLEQIRGTGNGHRVHTERNLAAVLKQIELKRPSDSRLLQHGAGPHGGMARANFYGPAGEKQLKMLRNWVRAASMELRPNLKPAQQPHSLAQQQQPKFPIEHGPIQQTSATDDEAESQASVIHASEDVPTAGKRSRPLSNPLSRSGGEGTKPRRTGLDEPAFLPQSVPAGQIPATQSHSEALAKEAGDEVPDIEPDAFDPEEFNRRHHGERFRAEASGKSRDRKTIP